jgi:hypothetical protein
MEEFGVIPATMLLRIRVIIVIQGVTTLSKISTSRNAKPRFNRRKIMTVNKTPQSQNHITRMEKNTLFLLTYTTKFRPPDTTVAAKMLDAIAIHQCKSTAIN